MSVANGAGCYLDRGAFDEVMALCAGDEETGEQELSGHGGEPSDIRTTDSDIKPSRIMSSLVLVFGVPDSRRLSISAMKIAVLTSGGDSAGMNAVVRTVVNIGILRQVSRVV